MNDILKKIFADKVIYIDDKKYDLNSNIDIEEGEFLRYCINSINATKTIEVGCAQGISSLFICDELKEKISAHHTIIDPYQTTEWESIGIKNLQLSGFSNFELIEKPSEIALPQLLSENRIYDMAFIDGWHTFDHTLLDFFYLNRMIKVGGLIIIDDTGMPAVKKAIRYILKYPSYKLFGNSGKLNETFSRRLINGLYSLLSPLTFVLGKKVRSEVFQDTFINSDKKLNINSSMIAFIKVSADDRPWNWYKDF